MKDTLKNKILNFIIMMNPCCTFIKDNFPKGILCLELKYEYVNKIKRFITYRGVRILKYKAYQKEKAQQSEH